jgi:hypothetical protein
MSTMSILDTRNSAAFAGVFVQTNEQGTNRVLAFGRGPDGALEPAGEYPTGGAGLGAVHLGSQGSVILTSDGRFLLVTNAGSNDVAVFAVRHDGLELVRTTPSARTRCSASPWMRAGCWATRGGSPRRVKHRTASPSPTTKRWW